MIKNRGHGDLFKCRKIDVLSLSETKIKGKGEVAFGELLGCIYGVVT